MNDPTLPTTESKRNENVHVSSLNVNYFSNLNKKRHSSLFNNIKTSLLDDSISNINYDLKRKSEEIDKFFIISYFIISLLLVCYFITFIYKFDLNYDIGIYAIFSTFSVIINLAFSLILSCFCLLIKFIFSKITEKKDDQNNINNSGKKTEKTNKDNKDNSEYPEAVKNDKNESNKKSIELSKNKSKKFNRNSNIQSNINSNLSLDNAINNNDEELKRNNSNISKFSSTSSSNLYSNSTEFSINLIKNDYPNSLRKYFRTFFVGLFIIMYLLQFIYGLKLIFRYISFNSSIKLGHKPGYNNNISGVENNSDLFLKYNSLKYSFFVLFQTFLAGLCLIFIVKKINFQRKSMKINIDEDFIKQAEREIKEAQLASGHIQPSQKLIKMNNLFNRQQNRISNDDEEIYKKYENELTKQSHASNFSNKIITSTVKKEDIENLAKEYERSKTTIQRILYEISITMILKVVLKLKFMITLIKIMLF